MKLILSCSIFLLLTTTGSRVYSQETKRAITGIVTSFEEALPLEGVKVEVKGSKNSSGSQADGVYYINISPNDSILIFSLPGYESKEIVVTKSNEYNVSLHAGKSDMPAISFKDMFCIPVVLYFRC